MSKTQLEKEQHFWVSDVLKRLPIDLLPKNPSWNALLDAITQLATERDELAAQVERERDDLADQVQSLVDAVMFGNDDDVLHAAERFVDAARAKTKGAEK